ncbi:MAG: hypothetical protein Q8P02_02120 [Candidatus Micrarchaeota archaeon]|nr:hypothetical protein [Candidatus Micrarchaeota archaeon]
MPFESLRKGFQYLEHGMSAPERESFSYALTHSSQDSGKTGQVAERLHEHLKEMAANFRRSRDAFSSVDGRHLDSGLEKMGQAMKNSEGKNEYKRLQGLFLADYSEEEVQSLSSLLNSSIKGQGFRTRIENAPNALLSAMDKRPDAYPSVDKTALDRLRQRLMDAFA